MTDEEILPQLEPQNHVSLVVDPVDDQQDEEETESLLAKSKQSNTNTKKLSDVILESLSLKTPFSKKEIHAIFKETQQKFFNANRKFDPESTLIPLEKVLKMKYFNKNPLRFRLFEVLEAPNEMSFEELVQIISPLSKASQNDKKIKSLFSIYIKNLIF